MDKIYTVVAAGGLGTRLKSFRNNQSTKMLLKIKNEAMIVAQIKQLLSWGLSDFIIITNKNYDSLLRDVIDEVFPGINVQYSIQKEQLGVAHALLQAKKFTTKNSKIIFILGDNFFENNPIKDINLNNTESTIFLKKVKNPEEFGVVELNDDTVISIEEKPKFPKSNVVATGLYIFDKDCFDYILKIKPSKRGEYEITNLIEQYINKSNLYHKIIKGWWIDAGTPESIEKLEELI